MTISSSSHTEKLSLFSTKKLNKSKTFEGVKKMIDYALQLRKFSKVVKSVKISSSAQTLYFNLMSFFDERCFPTTLKIDNATLYRSTRLSHEQLRKARLELQKLALIDYSQGKGSSSGSYIMFNLELVNLKDLCADCRELELLSEPKTLDIAQFAKKFDYLSDRDQVYLNLICETLKKALLDQQSGIFAGTYETARAFITAKNELVQDTIHKLIFTLRNKADINNKQAYILTVLKNEAKTIREKNKYQEVYRKALEKGFDEVKAKGLADEWKTKYQLSKLMRETA